MDIPGRINRRAGKVYLVGAGPGDPDLITCKGRDILSIADCVLYDHLANEELLRLVPQRAERIFVGKTKDLHIFSQEEISRVLVDRGRKGLTVVRLKGGDPFIFGRGGEELEALAEEGIPFEVVPGVPSPLGVAAYTGVPLTHREHTSAVTFVTGHHVPQIEWDKVGRSDTLVIFMGLHKLESIAGELIGRARAPETPAMAVSWGATPRQRSVAGTLATLPGLVRDARLEPPALIVVGEVVRLRDQLNWFERLPLFGQRILVTRASSQSSELAVPLRALGADVMELPVIEIQPPENYDGLDQALGQLSSYDWLIFTSVNGVRAFVSRLDQSPTDLRSLRAKICAIGPATKRAIEALHLKVEITPAEYVAEDLVAAFNEIELQGKRVLLPRATVARDVIPTALRRRGANVDVVPAYRTGMPTGLAGRIAELWENEGYRPQWVTFTSSSTVSHFLRAAGPAALHSVQTASIGPVTSATLRTQGFEPTVEAIVYTIDGLVDALLGYQR